MISILLALVVFGLCAWLVLTYIPMPQPVKTIVIAVGVLMLVIWLLRYSGLTHI